MKVVPGTYTVLFEGVANDKHFGVITQNQTPRNVSNIDIVQGLTGGADSLRIVVQSGDAYATGQYIYLDTINGITVPAGINKHFHRIVNTNGVDTVYVLATRSFRCICCRFRYSYTGC